MRLTDQERRYVNYLAAAAVALFLLLQEPWQGSAQAARFGLGVAFAASLFLLGRLRNRLWTAFGSLTTGLFGPWDEGTLVGSIYVAFAFWLVWRARREAGATRKPKAQPRATAMPRAAPVASGRFTPKKTKKKPARPKQT